MSPGDELSHLSLLFGWNREAELAEEKAQLEERALKVLSDDLSE